MTTCRSYHRFAGVKAQRDLTMYLVFQVFCPEGKPFTGPGQGKGKHDR